MIKYWGNTNKEYGKMYPVIVQRENGRKVHIPQQKKFGTYCSNHGCSVTAVSIAIQWRGVLQKDKSVWNPKEVYEYAKKNISGYNGSKLGIFGCMNTINKICGPGSATWHPIAGVSPDYNIKMITLALHQGKMVLFEEDNPIHTVAILGFAGDGKILVATNGKVVKRSLKTEYGYAFKGTHDVSNQKNWFDSRKRNAGFVFVKG